MSEVWHERPVDYDAQQNALKWNSSLDTALSEIRKLSRCVDTALCTAVEHQALRAAIASVEALRRAVGESHGHA